MQQWETTTSDPIVEVVSGLRYDRDGLSEVGEVLAIEAPLEIRLNGRPFTVTMRTPGHDALLARGLLHTEAVLAPEARVELAERPGGGLHDVTVIDVLVDPSAVLRDVSEERTLVATTSCGLCGRTQFRPDELSGGCPLTLPAGERARPALFPSMMTSMRAAQQTFDASGGVHAAALFDANGALLCLFEDVGRHNAVDKAVGWLLGPGAGSAPMVLAVSGRVSYEIVIKCWRAKVPTLIAVSAPTSLAVRTAQRLGVELAGFCRDTRATIYTTPPERLRP